MKSHHMLSYTEEGCAVKEILAHMVVQRKYCLHDTIHADVFDTHHSTDFD